MITEATDIAVLAERVGRASEALKIAHEAKRVAHEAYQAAEEACGRAYKDFKMAENDLVVAAGGTDNSFLWQ